MFKKICNIFKNINTDLIIFLIIHFVLWSLIPIFRQSMPMDSIEAIIWGQNAGWMTNKHPPFSGFTANIFYQIFFHRDISMYILSQLCVLIGFIYIYKLAKLFLDENKSVLSVMLLEGTIYYGFTSTEFNVNVISLALWPITIYYFYKSIYEDKLKDWLILGISIAINILNKYSCTYLFFGIFIYLIASPNARKCFLNKNLYICGFLALLCISPHLYWLYKTNFVVFEYFESRTVFEPELGILAHAIFPLKFIFSQFIAGIVTIILFIVAYVKSEKLKTVVSSENKLFITCIGILPIFIAVLPSIISGMKLKSMWGTPCLYMLTIVLFTFFNFDLKDEIYKKLKRFSYFVMIFAILCNTISTITTKSIRFYFPKNTFIQDMTNYWKDETNNSQLKYVIGDIWYTSHLSLYQKDKPKVIYDIDRKYKNILNDSKLSKYGVLITCTSREEMKYYQNIIEIEEPIREYTFKTKNLLGKGREYTMYYSIVLPKLIEE